MTKQITVPESTVAEMRRMKAYFPYRIVFAVLENGVWSVQARTTKAAMNNAARKGLPVAQLEY